MEHKREFDGRWLPFVLGEIPYFLEEAKKTFTPQHHPPLLPPHTITATTQHRFLFLLLCSAPTHLTRTTPPTNDAEGYPKICSRIRTSLTRQPPALPCSKKLLRGCSGPRLNSFVPAAARRHRRRSNLQHRPSVPSIPIVTPPVPFSRLRFSIA